MIAVYRYWAIKERIRAKTGKLPANSFDFVSIHPPCNGHGYSLVSPLCLCELNGVCRPEFEQDHFITLKQAERAARIICAFAEKEIGRKIGIVYCNN
jgi:hypothetical protein